MESIIQHAEAFLTKICEKITVEITDVDKLSADILEDCKELSRKIVVEAIEEGESIPVNQKLSDLFLQLHISERSGRGVPKITEVYGENAFEFRENSIVVSLPFNRIDGDMVDNVVDKSNDLNETQQKILMEIRNNPNVTQPQLAILVGIGKTTVQNNIVVLKRKGLIERVGLNKPGTGKYWNDKIKRHFGSVVHWRIRKYV